MFHKDRGSGGKNGMGSLWREAEEIVHHLVGSSEERDISQISIDCSDLEQNGGEKNLQ